MFNWLRRILGSSTRMLSNDSTRSKAPLPLPKLKVTISIGTSSAKKAAEIQSHALRQLWIDVCTISHADYPFLNERYSPSSNMPCADFTLWIAARLAASDWTSIVELLEFIAFKNEIAAIRKTFQNFDFDRFIDADSDLLFRLKAVAILAYRIGWMGHENSRLLLLEEIYQHCLALYPFTVHPTAFPHLLSGANKLIRSRNREGLGFGGNLLTEEQLTNFPPISSVGATLRNFPPTFGACITLSLQRGTPISGTILLRLGGEYGLRQYGLSEEQNSKFAQQCGFFEPASDVRALSQSLTKEVFLEMATAHGIKAKKSWKKERLLDSLLKHDRARATLAARAPTGFVQYMPETRELFGSWRARVIAVQSVARCLACA